LISIGSIPNSNSNIGNTAITYYYANVYWVTVAYIEWLWLSLVSI